MSSGVKNLGKKLKVGAAFSSVSRWSLNSKPLIPQLSTVEPYHQYREGHHGYFQKGNRRYYCEVIAILGIEMRWSYSYFPCGHNIKYGHAELGVKQYRYTYLLKIIQN